MDAVKPSKYFKKREHETFTFRRELLEKKHQKNPPEQHWKSS